MTKCNTWNEKLSNLLLNKLKSTIKIGTEVTSNRSSNVIDNSNDETNFPHKLLSTDTRMLWTRKNFETCSSANIKLSKTQLSNIVHLAGEDFCDILNKIK